MSECYVCRPCVCVGLFWCVFCVLYWGLNEGRIVYGFCVLLGDEFFMFIRTCFGVFWLRLWYSSTVFSGCSVSFRFLLFIVIFVFALRTQSHLFNRISLPGICCFFLTCFFCFCFCLFFRCVCDILFVPSTVRTVSRSLPLPSSGWR